MRRPRRPHPGSDNVPLTFVHDATTSVALCAMNRAGWPDPTSGTARTVLPCRPTSVYGPARSGHPEVGLASIRISSLFLVLLHVGLTGDRREPAVPG